MRPPADMRFDEYLPALAAALWDSIITTFHFSTAELLLLCGGKWLHKKKTLIIILFSKMSHRRCRPLSHMFKRQHLNCKGKDLKQEIDRKAFRGRRGCVLHGYIKGFWMVTKKRRFGGEALLFVCTSACLHISPSGKTNCSGTKVLSTV